jgi:hypothetical protein
MKKSVFALAVSEEQANHIVDHLLSAGFLNEDISTSSEKTTSSR